MRALFLEKCSSCHDAGIAYGAMSSRLQWMRTVAAMALKEDAAMDREAVRDLFAYQSYCRAHARTLFSRLCGECHDFETMEVTGRSLRQWRTMVTYMAGRWGVPVTDEERELLATFIGR